MVLNNISQFIKKYIASIKNSYLHTNPSIKNQGEFINLLSCYVFLPSKLLVKLSSLLTRFESKQSIISDVRIHHFIISFLDHLWFSCRLFSLYNRIWVKIPRVVYQSILCSRFYCFRQLNSASIFIGFLLKFDSWQPKFFFPEAKNNSSNWMIQIE